MPLTQRVTFPNLNSITKFRAFNCLTRDKTLLRTGFVVYKNLQAGKHGLLLNIFECPGFVAELQNRALYRLLCGLHWNRLAGPGLFSDHNTFVPGMDLHFSGRQAKYTHSCGVF